MEKSGKTIIGVYKADGGFVGEISYFLGHLIGVKECSLSDITHSPIMKKKAPLEMGDVLPVLSELPETLVYESQIETQQAAQVSVLTGRTPGSQRVDVTLLRDGYRWKIADLSHDGKLLSAQLGAHCDYIAREAAALERAAAQSEAEADASTQEAPPAS